SANARIGNHSIIHIHSSIGHDSQIGEYCAILPGARISGDVVLEDHVLIGSNSFVFQGTQVGRNARIDALTYVRDDIPEKSTLSCRRSNH
ncbi:acyltransferase, partial [bacterium]|nr:acyltransferase [bacterium]